MEYEQRYTEECGECLQCCYFYEWTAISIMIERAKPYHRDIRKQLRELHFQRIGIGEKLIRVGYIEKTPDTIGKPHITNAWFAIPHVFQKREMKIRWIELTKEQRKSFDRIEWLAGRSVS